MYVRDVVISFFLELLPSLNVCNEHACAHLFNKYVLNTSCVLLDATRIQQETKQTLPLAFQGSLQWETTVVSKIDVIARGGTGKWC